MIHVILHCSGQTYEQNVPKNSNLVVLAGLKKFPGLRYGCGMGRCTRCASKVISGGEHLPTPTWKEEKMLGDKLNEGYRLLCQMSINHNIELIQEETPLKPAWKRMAQKL